MAAPLFFASDDPLRDDNDDDDSRSDPLAGGGSGSGSGSDPLAAGGAHGTAHGSLFAADESSSDNEDNPFSSKEDQTEQLSASGGATSTATAAAPNESAFASLALNDNPPMPVNDMQPPPAYETMQHASSSSSAAAAAAAAAAVAAAPTAAPTPETVDGEFVVTVSDPAMQGDGVGAYVTYRVTTQTDLPQYASTHSTVIRRYRDFEWLANRLSRTNMGIIIPPLPKKSHVQHVGSKVAAATGSSSQNTPVHERTFIEQRRAALQKFLTRVVSHPVLAYSRDLQLFLEATEEDWKAAVARTPSTPTPGAASTGGGGLQGTLRSLETFFNGVETAATAVMKDVARGGSPASNVDSQDENDDPEYVRLRQYVMQLDHALAEAERQMGRMLRRQSRQADQLAELAASFRALCGMEGGPDYQVDEVTADAQAEAAPVAARCLLLASRRCLELSQDTRTQTSQLADAVQPTMSEWLRAVASLKSVMEDRSALVRRMKGTDALIARLRVSVSKLQATPGKEGRAAEEDFRLQEAITLSGQLRGDHEALAARMAEEVARFQKSRTEELAMTMRSLAAGEARLSSDTARAWRQIEQGIAGVAAAG